MSLRLNVPTPLEYFASLVQSDEQFPLLEAAASIAQDEYPGLDVQELLSHVDQMIERVKRRMPAAAPAMQRLRLLNHFFFADMGFAGNVNNYYDAENSYLNAVLRTRKGIPISLAVLWLEMAQGIGLHARGVAFPGHFLVKALLPKGQVVIDPMSGTSFGREELSERLEPFKQTQDLLDESDVPLGVFLQAATPRDIIARMLRNLKEVHATEGDWQRLIAVQDRLIVLLPNAWEEWRDRGIAYAESGQAPQAVADLEIYLDHAKGAVDTASVAQRLGAVRKAAMD